MIARSTISRKPSRKVRRERASGDAVKVYDDGREVCLSNAAGRTEYDSRRDRMADRQGKRCAICNFPFDGYLGPATFEHQDGRTSGHRDERTEIDGEWYNAALHGVCNGLKGSRRYHWVGKKFQPVRKEAA